MVQHEVQEYDRKPTNSAVSSMCGTVDPVYGCYVAISFVHGNAIGVSLKELEAI